MDYREFKKARIALRLSHGEMCDALGVSYKAIYRMECSPNNKMHLPVFPDTADKVYQMLADAGVSISNFRQR